MSCINTMLSRARRDEPVYISEVRETFNREGSRPFTLAVTLYDDTRRDFAGKLPVCENADEEAFVRSYVHAMLYNILSSLGAVRIEIYTEDSDTDAMAMISALDAVFQTALPMAERSGYGKCLNVNERTLRAIRGSSARFAFVRRSIAEYKPAPVQQEAAASNVPFAKLPDMTKDKLCLGIDVGGTDIKMAASLKGKLAVLKEYDWFPAMFATAEQLIDPILQLTRLLKAVVNLKRIGREDLIATTAPERTATDADMEKAVEAMENALGEENRRFDTIGMCFPDVVIRNRIVGGETYKTRGMRENKALDYEKQFAKITRLHECLAEYATNAQVHITNDGPMASFTTAVEQATMPDSDLSKGCFAHTLGTELGTGWILGDGSISEIPLEVYNFIIDLGSFVQREYATDDVRSINNFNTKLPGTLQKYTSQSGVFRLAAKLLPEREPALYKELFEKGLFAVSGDSIVIPTEPKDMRKPCLEFLMKQAEVKGSVCEQIFREIGVYLAQTFLETDYILRPATKERTLFGRLVKTDTCYRLQCEGADSVVPGLRMNNADGSLARTSLMRQLEADPDYTVAQFAQAIGALYYGLL